MNRDHKSEPGLIRKLNFTDTALLVIGSVLGSGIFLTTGYIAELVSSPFQIMAVWALGGLMTLGGAVTFAELGALFPQAGGQYVYLREAYGPLAGFLFGWAFFWVIECGGIAALAVGFAEYFGFFFPSLSTETILFSFPSGGAPVYQLSAGQLVALVTMAGLSFINYFGIKSGVFVQNVFTMIKILSVGLLVIGGFFFSEASNAAADLAPGAGHSPAPSGGGFNLGLFGLALIAVFWTYDGWYAVSCTAGEIKNPQRNIPLGLTVGTLGISAIYLLINIFYLKALPVGEMAGVTRIAEYATHAALGSKAAFYISGLIMISIFGCLSATVIYGPRVYYAMAEDGVFFSFMSHIHPKYHVPSKAIFWQAVWSGFLCLSGTFQALYEYVVFALMLFFAATGIAVFVLRRTRRNLHRPYKVWGYPFMPLLFILVNIGVFLNTLWSQPRQSGIGLLILLLGIPYYAWKKRRNLRPPEIR